MNWIQHLYAMFFINLVFIINFSGISPPEFDNLTLAVIRGRLVRYLMRSKEVNYCHFSSDARVSSTIRFECLRLVTGSWFRENRTIHDHCQITLGRAAKDNQIDVDLALEGPAWKISRRQGMIKLKKNGDFYIANEGKRPIYVDGKAVLTGNKEQLNNNSVIEVCVAHQKTTCRHLYRNVKR